MNHINRIVLLLLLFGFSCENEENQIFGTGTFEATEVRISSQATGQILEMAVDEGQPVTKDEVIARIDVEKLMLQKKQLEAALEEVKLSIALTRQQVEQARIQHDNLNTRYQRFLKLLEDKSIPQQQVDDLKTKLDIADRSLKSARIQSETVMAKQNQLEAQIALLDRQISDGIIRSPLDGLVIQKLKEPGELITMGGGLFQIANLQQMEIRIYVSEFDLGHIKLGESLAIFVDSFPDKHFSGTVSWISPRAEFTPKNVQTREARTNLVYAVKLKVENPNGELKIGMPAEVSRK